MLQEEAAGLRLLRGLHSLAHYTLKSAGDNFIASFLVLLRIQHVMILQPSVKH